MSSMCHGSKLEHWQHPEVEGSIQPNALRSASRNPKLFFGVSVISKVCQKCTQIKKKQKKARRSVQRNSKINVKIKSSTPQNLKCLPRAQ